MGVGRIGADDHDDVGMFDQSKSCVPAEVPKVVFRLAGRRMADAGAGIDVVVAEAAADQLLHQIGFLIGAAGEVMPPTASRPYFCWMPLNSPRRS